MQTFIIADNQELTSLALESLLRRDERNVVFRTSCKAELFGLLKEHEQAVVLLDYTLFDFPDEDSLLITSERYAMTKWVLVSEELTAAFLRKVVYSSHAFSVVFKDLLEKPREFDPRGQATMTPTGKNTLTPYGKIKMTPENDCFSGAFL